MKKKGIYKPVWEVEFTAHSSDDVRRIEADAVGAMVQVARVATETAESAIAMVREIYQEDGGLLTVESVSREDSSILIGTVPSEHVFGQNATAS